MNTLHTLFGHLPDPLHIAGGAHGTFEDINVLDAELAVVGAWSDSRDLMVANIAADGTVDPGPTIETDSYDPLVAPLPDERAAVLAYEYGMGLRLWTGSIETPPEPEPEIPDEPEVPEEPEAPVGPDPTVSGAGSITSPTQLDLLDDGATQVALARKLWRQVGCSVACSVRASGKIGIPLKGGGNKVFELRRSSRFGQALSPIDVSVGLKRAAYRLALAALRRDKPVLVQLRLAASAAGLSEVRRKTTLVLQRPVTG
jgi:hypothetical protein